LTDWCMSLSVNGLPHTHNDIRNYASLIAEHCAGIILLNVFLVVLQLTVIDYAAQEYASQYFSTSGAQREHYRRE